VLSAISLLQRVILPNAAPLRNPNPGGEDEQLWIFLPIAIEQHTLSSKQPSKPEDKGELQ
jgi:hypothetical protein